MKRTGNPSEVRYCCPWCGDTKYHLYLNTKYHVFFCFRCGSKGTETKLFQKLKLATVPEVVEQKPRKREKPELIDIDGKGLLQMVAKRYWLKRGLTLQEMYDYDVKINPRRVSLVIPVKDENGIHVYNVERLLLDSERKYYNEPGAKIHEYLFNLDKAKVFDRIFLVEGIFDAISIGKQGVAILGKYLSEKGLEKLRSLGFRKISVLLDSDAAPEALVLWNRLLPFFDTEVLDISSTGYKDISEFRQKEGLCRMKEWLKL